MVLVRGGITVKPHVQKAADEVVAEFGPGLSPGTYNGHSPPEGPTQALDLFNPTTNAGWELQYRVAGYLIKHAKRLGVRYVIRWNPNGADWIWNIERADEGWRAMATRDHRDHVHVTFYSKAADTAPEPPANLPEGEIGSMKVRYIWGPDALNQTDWLFDGPSRIFAQIGHATVLKACDLNKVPELGRVDDQAHEWFKGVAASWR